MAYSDLNYAPPKVVKAVFGLTDGKFTMLSVQGKFRFKRKYKNPLVLMDSLASLYEDRENIVVKRWGYDYESPQEKYESMMRTKLTGHPRCFFRISGDVPDAYYRAFYRGRALKVCIFVFDGIARCVCFSREHADELEQLFFAFDEGKVDVEG